MGEHQGSFLSGFMTRRDAQGSLSFTCIEPVIWHREGNAGAWVHKLGYCVDDILSCMCASLHETDLSFKCADLYKMLTCHI